MPAKVIKQRLQIQPIGRPGIDRSVTYFIGEPDTEQRKRVRGVWFVVANAVAAKRHIADLERLAQQAVDAREVDQFLASLDHPDVGAPDTGPTFGDFTDQWIDKVFLANGHPESERETTIAIVKNHLRPYFGEHHLTQVSSRMIDEYKAKKRTEKHQYGTGYSGSAINAHLSVMNRIFKKAMEYGHVKTSPVLSTAWLKREKTPEDSENWWTPDEEAKAFAFLRNEWSVTYPDRYLPMLTQLLTGVRIGELRVLQPRDLELNATLPGIWIRRSMARKSVSTPKNKHARFVPVPKPLAEELREWAKGREPDTLLFPAKHGGPLRNNVVNHWFEKLAAQAGVRRISSHGARHTTGSTLALMGVGQKVIGMALGHRDSKATERYTHVQALAVGPLSEARWQKLDKFATDEKAARIERFVATDFAEGFIRVTPPETAARPGAPDQHA